MTTTLPLGPPPASRRLRSVLAFLSRPSGLFLTGVTQVAALAGFAVYDRRFTDALSASSTPSFADKATWATFGFGLLVTAVATVGIVAATGERE